MHVVFLTGWAVSASSLPDFRRPRHSLWVLAFPNLSKEFPDSRETLLRACLIAPRRADAETPPSVCLKSMNYNSHSLTCRLLVSRVGSAGIAVRTHTRYMRNVDIASVCVASLV